MANTITIDILADTRKLVQGVDQANASLRGIQGSVAGINKLAGAFASLGIAAAGFAKVGGLIKEGVMQAVEYNDMLNVTQTTFDKTTASGFIKEANTLAQSMGISARVALDLINNFGAIGKAAGLGGKDLQQFAERNRQLAVDLRSYKGGRLEDVQRALISGYSGQYEALRRYNIYLSEAQVKQKAYDMRLIKSTKQAIDPQIRSLAVEALVQEQATDAKGDFARTNDQAANSLEKFNAEVENSKKALGEALLPGLTTVLNFINKTLLPAFKGLPAPIKAFILTLAGLAVVIPSIVLFVGALKMMIPIALGAGASLGWVVLIAVAIAALVAVGVLLYKNWDTIKAKAKEVWENIKEFFGGIPGWFKEKWDGAWEAVSEFWTKVTTWLGDVKDWLGSKFSSAWNVISDTFKTVFSKAWTFFKEFPGKVVEWLKGLPGRLKTNAENFMNIGEAIVKGIWKGITGMASWLKEKVTGFFGNVSGWAKKVLGIKSPSKVFMEFGKNVVLGFSSGIDNNSMKAYRSTNTMASMAVAGVGGTTSGRGSAPINITINAGLGTDAYEIGRIVSQSLSKYENINGGR